MMETDRSKNPQTWTKRKGESRQNFINIFIAIFIAVMGGLVMLGIGFWGKLYLTVDKVKEMVVKQKEDNSTHHRRMNAISIEATEAKEMAIEACVRGSINERRIEILEIRRK